MSETVTYGTLEASERVVIVGLERAASRTHAGHWNPTDAWAMQLGQIGRPQRWQLTPARRSGCR
jgi:hypothetical protein